MAISAPVELGTRNINATSATCVLTRNATAHVAGRPLIVAIMTSSTVALSTVTDSVGNNYTIDNGVPTTRGAWIAKSDGAIALPATTGTITATFASSVSGSRKMYVASVVGMGVLDAAPTEVTGTVAAWTCGATGTLANASEIVFGVNTRGSGVVTSAPTAGWTELYDNAADSLSGTVVYQIVSATTSVNPGGTWSAGGTAWRGCTASYQEAGSAPQNVNPTGIASAEAFGAPSITPGNVNISPTGIASAEAFGVPRLDQRVSPGGIASGEAFGTPTITVGNVNVSATSIASLEAFGAPTFTLGATSINPVGIVSLEAFGVPTFVTGNNVTPTGIASAEAFGAPRIDQTVNPVGIASAEAFGTVGRVDQFVHPSGIVTAEAFGTPTMDGGAVGPVGPQMDLMRRGIGV